MVTFCNKVTKIRKYYVIFVYILQGKMGKMEIKQKENHATKVTKILKTKRRKYGMNETLKELFFLFCSFQTKYLHILWPHQGLSTMIALILNINVQTELVVRLLMENLVVAHMKVRKFLKEIVVFSILQKNKFHNFCPSI